MGFLGFSSRSVLIAPDSDSFHSNSGDKQKEPREEPVPLEWSPPEAQQQLLSSLSRHKQAHRNGATILKPGLKQQKEKAEKKKPLQREVKTLGNAASRDGQEKRVPREPDRAGELQ